jgi:ferritin-like metal-binding protein YciE
LEVFFRMSQAGKAKVIQLLIEAHSNEVALINVLSTHSNIAKNGPYRSLLESHLRETKQHAERIQQRLTRLGHRDSIVSMGYGLVQSTVKQGLVMAKAPVDMIRGRTNVHEKMLRNAMDEVMTEGMEIATYDAIESLARSVGDNETADLAAEIRVDEEQMLESLRKEIPGLANLVAQTEVPPSERANVGEPWPGYDEMTVAEIRKGLDDASASLLLAVRDYERRNKNRTTVIDATEKETSNA